MQPESRVRRFTHFLRIWLSHTGCAQPLAASWRPCKWCSCRLRFGRASSLRASLPWRPCTAAGLVGTGRPSLRPQPVSSCCAATAVPALPLADSKWVQLPAGSSSSTNDADGNSSLHIPCTPHAWAFPNNKPSCNRKHSTQHQRQAPQRPPRRAHPRAQRNLPGQTCPRISLHRACLRRCQLCSPSLARVTGRERERERLPRSPPKERPRAETVASGTMNTRTTGTTRATSTAAGIDVSAEIGWQDVVCAMLRPLLELPGLPLLRLVLSLPAMVGECHLYLRLFSRLVGHDQVNCPSTRDEGRQSLPQRNGFPMCLLERRTTRLPRTAKMQMLGLHCRVV